MVLTRLQLKAGVTRGNNDDDEVEEDWSAPGDDVYDESTFDARLMLDLKTAKHLVLIESPFLAINRILIYSNALLNVTRRGVRVCVFSQKPHGWDNRAGLSEHLRIKYRQIDEAIEHLRKLGLHVTLRSRLHAKSIIIDCRVLFRGSLNPLSFFDTIEEVVRKESAVESMRTIKRRQLHECSECEVINMDPVCDLNLDAAVIGAHILERRTRMQLTQAQLAQRANVDRMTLSRLEKGERLPAAEPLSQIYSALGYRLLAIPEGAAAFIPEIMRIAPLNQSDKKPRRAK